MVDPTWFESMHLANTFPIFVFLVIASLFLSFSDSLKGVRPMYNVISAFFTVLVSFSISWVVGNGMPVCLSR